MSLVKNIGTKDNAQEYVVVDIETTGGSVSSSRITEIAILTHNGSQVTSRWQSLVNPEMYIPMHITALTGIDDEMVADAPTFADLANEVYHLLLGKIFVAHNVNFDYSFLRGQLAACGFSWDAPKLCTVRLSRKLFPGMTSYSLGKLCNQLNISLIDRHRALGDADATAKLFTMLVEKDRANAVTEMVKKKAVEQRLPPNLSLADFDNLPESPGVYYFLNQKGKVIYVGKAINIRKRVTSHFSGNSGTAKRQNFLREIYNISFELTGSELMALLLECVEIQRLWPIYNSALKRFEPKFGLYHYVSVNGYSHLAVGKLPKQQKCLKTFNREVDGINYLVEKSNQLGIDLRFCRYGQAPSYKIDTPLPTLDAHNNLVDVFLQSVEDEQPSFAILLKGRDLQERGCVYVEKGEFYGMGFLDNDFSVHDIAVLKDKLTRYSGGYYMLQLILTFAERYPSAIIKLDHALV